MAERIRQILEKNQITASAPCRIDAGGTLDISSLFYPLAYLEPCTFNIAVNMRTRVTLGAWQAGRVRVVSRGFDPAEYSLDEMPFDHRLGLVFAIAAYLRIDGICIEIESASPPRSALGGSSAAAVALIAAYSRLLRKDGKPGGAEADAIPVLAHAIEESIAGVPCGMQDQLAATYGGVNAWHWKEKAGRPAWKQQRLLSPQEAGRLSRHILVAYCGVPHESKDINGAWIRGFLSGRHRRHWAEIADTTKRFVRAFAGGDFSEAARWMNRETEIRRELTPEVVDEIGAELIAAAVNRNCGARFTGAGGGGCLWALGSAEAVSELCPEWEKIVARHPDGAILDVKPDPNGIK